MLLNLLELIDILVKRARLTSVVFTRVDLPIEFLCVGATLTNVNVVVGHHFFFELELTASAHRNINLLPLDRAHFRPS